MKLREIFRFEFGYQVRRPWPWLFLGVMFVFAFVVTQIVHPADEVFFNAPSVIAFFSVMGVVIWLLVGAAVAGEAAARDVETKMHPLKYTAPISRIEYLGGRFVAAFVLNALILLALPAGMLLGLYTRGLDAALLGPFRPAAYLTVYFFIALPNAFVATALQFSLAVRSRRAISSYLASVMLIVTSQVVGTMMGHVLGHWELAKVLDFVGVVGIVSEMETWTPIEVNTRLVMLEGARLANRLLWFGIALGTLTFTYVRFRFDHPAALPTWWTRITRPRKAHILVSAGTAAAVSTRIPIPRVRQAFGFSTCARQTLAIAWTSFRTIARSRTGLTPVAAMAMGSAAFASEWMMHMDSIPLLARTAEVIRFLTPPLSSIQTLWIIIPLLTIFYAGELVWREREAGVSEITDTSPVPEWVLFLGKFLGLAFVLIAWLALLMAAGILIQAGLGHSTVEVGLYLQTLFGLQFADYLLFALLVLVVHVAVDQKYVGHLVAFIAYGFIVFASRLGIEHNLAVYGADPGWSYTDMRGFGPSPGPWLWFTLYWAAWALLLAVAARLLWVRGRESGLRERLRLARSRFKPRTAGAAMLAVALILAAGRFIFYNTNVLNRYRTASDLMELRAEYERRYGRFEGIPQPRLTGTNLRVEIYPEGGEAEIRGSYRLVNNTGTGIDSIHVATASGVETGEIVFNRPASRVLADADLGHRIYALERPLEPGDSLRLGFEVHFRPRGFSNSGVDASVAANGTYFTSQNWLPAIGYQSLRELDNAEDRRAHGLSPQLDIPSLYDVEARQDMTGFAERIAFEAVVGTDEDQIAIAPGTLRRTWTERGRRYFHYVADAPIGNGYALFSARYAVQEGEWRRSAGSEPAPGSNGGQAVAIQIFHHPGHDENVERMVGSVQASLSYYTEQFGPYPYGHIRIVEHPGHGRGMHADANAIDYQEGFSLLNPRVDRGDFDLPFYVVAHEVAHQWWGSQVAYARVEGAGLLGESLATYSAMGLVEQALGPEHLRRFLRFARAEYEVPRTRAAPPLLRAADAFHSYRKGPMALHALSEYIGKDRVHEALRRLLEKHGSGAPPLPTSLDLYRELQAVTPDSLQYLLHDLFESNTFWDLETEAVRSDSTATGEWQVTLDVRARKLVVDEAGKETEVPMDDWAEVGVFHLAQAGDELGQPLYLRKHRIRTGSQTITVTVPRAPARAGIDPRHLLFDSEMDDNVKQTDQSAADAIPDLI